MSPNRPAAALLVILALLTTAGAASAAVSTLTPNPSVTLPSARPAPPHAIVRRAAVSTGPQAPATSPPATPPPAARELPSTGIDAGLEALLGALLIATGAVLKARRPAAHSLTGNVELEPVPVG